MDSLDGIRQGLITLKVRLAAGELEPQRYRELREELLADLTPAQRARLSGVSTATPAIGPSGVAGKALRTQPPALAELDLAVGTVLLDQWCLRRELGRGGFGVVFEAEDRHLGELQAVKVLDPAMVAREELLARFRREVRVMRGLQHRHIVRVFDYREDLDRYLALISMELVASGSVATLLAAARAQSLRVAVVLAIVRQTLGALAVAHAAGVIHRDVTPSNVLLAGADSGRLLTDPEADPDVRLVDFGIAGMVETSELSQKSRVLGTAAYVAPEILDPGAEITAAVDVYGTGAMAYELLSGQTPMVTGFKSLARLRDDLAPALNELIMGMIAALPRERLSVAEALARLDALDAGAPVAAAEPSPAVTGPAPSAVVAPAVAEPPPPPTPAARATPAATDRPALDFEVDQAAPSTRSRLPMVALGAAGALVLVLGVLWLGSRPSRSAEPQAAAAVPGAASEAGAEPERAQLEVRSNVSGDTVTIDGRAHGPTPVKVSLAPGVHQIAVTRPGCEDDVRAVELAAAAELVHRATLRCAAPESTRQEIAETPPPPSSTPATESARAPPPPAVNKPRPTGTVSVVFAGSAAQGWSGERFRVNQLMHRIDSPVFEATEMARLVVPAGITSFEVLADDLQERPAVRFMVRDGQRTTVLCQVKGIVKHRIIISVDGRVLFDREYGLDGALQKVNT